jgi:hypothetical protein
MLDMEYEECVKATKGYNIEDYDQGPVGDEQQDEPPAPAATAGGYAAFGGSVGDWRGLAAHLANRGMNVVGGVPAAPR